MPRRMLRAYESWFEGEPEDSLLHIMGLFDRPAEKALSTLCSRRRRFRV